MKILFICTGNTCRSPMAEVLFRDLVEKEGLEGMEISSAGIFASPGDGANANAQEVMRERGLSLDGHGASILTAEMLAESDLILTMTMDHREIILQNFPQLEGKLFTLKEYVSDPEDIKSAKDINIFDPFGQSVDVYRKSGEEILENLKRLLEKVKEI